MTILCEVVLMGVSMIDMLKLFVIGDAQNKMNTVQRRHTKDDGITKIPYGKIDGTMFCDHETRAILMNPTQSVRGGMRGGR